MSRNLALYYDNILDSIAKIERFTADLETAKDFVEDEESFDAVVMNLQVIGESIKQIPEADRETYTQVDWRGMVGLRDIISHAYSSLEEDVIWNIIQVELAGLKDCIILMKSDFNKSFNKR